MPLLREKAAISITKYLSASLMTTPFIMTDCLRSCFIFIIPELAHQRVLQLMSAFHQILQKKQYRGFPQEKILSTGCPSGDGFFRDHTFLEQGAGHEMRSARVENSRRTSKMSLLTPLSSGHIIYRERTELVWMEASCSQSRPRADLRGLRGETLRAVNS